MSKIYQINNKLLKVDNVPVIRPTHFIRVRTNADNTPPIGSYDYAIQRDTRIYDVYKESDDWSYLFYNDHKNNPTVVEVIYWDISGVTSLDTAFCDCVDLTSVAYTDLSTVTNLHATFCRCGSLTSIPFFNTKNVTNMAYFLDATALTEIPFFDTHNVVYMNNAFSGTRITSAHEYDLSSATTVQGLFHSCSNLIDVPDYDIPLATNSEYMFWGCTSLTDIPDLNIPNVLYCTRMFIYCYNVETGMLRIYNKLKNTAGYYHSECFRDCGINTTAGSAELAQIPDDWK